MAPVKDKDKKSKSKDKDAKSSKSKDKDDKSAKSKSKDKKSKGDDAKSVKSSKSKTSKSKDKDSKSKDAKSSKSKSKDKDKKAKDKPEKGQEEEAKVDVKTDVQTVPFVNTTTVPAQQQNTKCLLHNKDLQFYCENTESLICYDCTVMGPHNTQLHRISKVDEAFAYRFQTLNKTIHD